MTERVGFVGLGRMGYHMGRHLRRAGFDVVGFDIEPDMRRRAAEAGLAVVDDLSAVAEAGVVLSSLPDSSHVASVYQALLGSLAAGSLCVDLSTIAVDTSRTLAAEARQRGVLFIDAPVSGTAIHAEAGTLAIMVGGPAEAVERARPLLASFSSSVHHLGGNGAGLEMKLVTNRLLTTHVVAIAEAIVEMEAAGLDVATGLDLLRAGAVPRLLDYKAVPMAARDFTPLFTVDLMSKDLRLAAERRAPGPLAAVASSVLDETRDAGMGPLDIGAVIELVERAMVGMWTDERIEP